MDYHINLCPPRGSLSSDLKPRTLRAISSSLHSQFPVTGVILSAKRMGVSTITSMFLIRSTTSTAVKRKLDQPSDSFLLFPRKSGRISAVLAVQERNMHGMVQEKEANCCLTTKQNLRKPSL